MGRESRQSDAAEQAQFERLVGAVRDHGKHDDACPKCSAPGMARAKRWCTGRNLLDPKPDGCKLVGEHLHVLCQACGYGWFERTRDYVPDPDEPVISASGVSGPNPEAA